MTRRHDVIGIIIIFFIIILQTTLLNNLSVLGAKPDYILIAIILFSNYKGSIHGDLLGFSTGLAEDFLSLSPLGFSALRNTVLGYLSGLTAGKIFLDSVIAPAIFVFIGTIIKSVLSIILLAFFMPEKMSAVYSMTFVVELGLNILITPFIYLFFKLLKVLPSSSNKRIL
jgi:rod shape-determining protein MreD